MVNLNDAYVDVKTGELLLLNCHITKWDTANVFDIQERRSRKLLAHRNEISRLKQKVSEQGYTLIPLRLYFSDNGKCKVLLGLCKGKHLYDKRKVEKEKEIRKEINCAI